MSVDSDSKILQSYKLAKRTSDLKYAILKNCPNNIIPYWLQRRSIENNDRIIFCLGFWKVYERYINVRKHKG